MGTKKTSALGKKPLNISVREAARLMGISPRRVHVLINEGRVPAFRVANTFVVTGIPTEPRVPGRPRVEKSTP
jgi:hypothetical protein